MTGYVVVVAQILGAVCVRGESIRTSLPELLWQEIVPPTVVCADFDFDRPIPCVTYEYRVKAGDGEDVETVWTLLGSQWTKMPPPPPPAGILYVDARAVGANDGSCWENAYRHLQDALDVPFRDHEIRVAQGVYRPDEGHRVDAGDREAVFQLANGVTVRGGYAGWGAPEPNTWDPKSYKTILSGDLEGDDFLPDDPRLLLDDDTRKENSHCIVVIKRGYETTVLDGLTITGSYAEAARLGGGLISEHGNALVKNCVFRFNCSTDRSGAVYSKTDELTFVDCVFGQNAGQTGGAIRNIDGESLTLIRCLFVGNVASRNGGAIYNEYMKTRGTPLLIDCLFSGNQADGKGGAIRNYGDCDPDLINCTFSANVSPEGGGLANHDNSSPKLTNCILWNNSPHGADAEAAQITGGRPIVSFCCIEGWSGWFGGVGNWGYDPLFVDPDGPDDIYGTVDDDLRLLPLSPCIDTGDNAALPPDVTEDVCGNPRIVDGDGDGLAIVDRGGYEWQGQGTPPQVTYPSAPGITWTKGETYTIEWAHFNCDSVKIELYRGSTLSRTIVASTSNDGSYVWKVASNQEIGSYYRIKICCASDSSKCDWSNNYFTIKDPDVPQVTYPSAWTIWTTGKSYTIRWRGFDCASVKIELYASNMYIETIAASTSNDGSYVWKVPSNQENWWLEWFGASYYRIKICCTSDSSKCDWSDNYFAILEQQLPLTEALDSTLSITTGGDAEWFGQTQVYNHDGDAARSGGVSKGQETWMRATIDVPPAAGFATVSFDWKINAQALADYLEFRIDGEFQDAIGGGCGWRRVSFTTSGAGRYELEWRFYREDVPGYVGRPAAWVDHLTVDY